MTARPVSKLEIWMRKNEISDETFAKMLTKYGIDTSPKYVSFIRLGVKRPSLRLAKAISNATNRNVAIIKMMEFKDTYVEWKSKASKFKLKQ